jgi:hypothetical protein
MASQWFYQAMGNEVGPITGSELQALTLRDVVSAFTLVRKAPDGDWVPANRVKGLFPASNETSSQSPATGSAPVEAQPPDLSRSAPVEEQTPDLSHSTTIEAQASDLSSWQKTHTMGVSKDNFVVERVVITNGRDDPSETEERSLQSRLDAAVRTLDKKGYDIVAVTPINEDGTTTSILVTAKRRPTAIH